MADSNASMRGSKSTGPAESVWKIRLVELLRGSGEGGFGTGLSRPQPKKPEVVSPK